MTALATTSSNLPAMYAGNELVELDSSDIAPRRIYMVQGNSRIRNVVDGLKLADIYLGHHAEDPTAVKIGGIGDDVIVYILAVSKGVVHIDKDQGGRLTFLTGQPDAEARLLNRERDIWRSYHYVVKVEGDDEPVSWMLTGYTGTQTAKDVNGMIKKRIDSGQSHVTPLLLKAITKSGNGNTWGAFKAHPTTGDPEELAAAIEMAAAGLSSMRYRQTENDAPTAADDDTF